MNTPDGSRLALGVPGPARLAVPGSGQTVLARARQRRHWHDWLAQGCLCLLALGLLAFLLLPLGAILVKSVQDRDGAFVGLARFADYLANPALAQSVLNTLTIALGVTALTIPAAFLFAYALTRSHMPGKGWFRLLALIPILSPSLLPAIAMVQWFGNQGVLKNWLGGVSIYGMPGIIISEFYCVFPHALMILITALTLADARLYEVADSLGTRRWRRFVTITLPGAKYGLISASMVVLTYVISDFGVPKVIGGNLNVLAIDVYKLVIGQQDFNRGAVVSLLLLLPTLFAFAADWLVRRRLQAQLSARAVPLQPKRNRLRDGLLWLYCSVLCLFLLAILGMAVFTSLIKLWPYNLSMSFDHYRFGLVEGGMIVAYWNSLKMAAASALFGTVIIFGGAYLLEKTRGASGLRTAIRLLVALPIGVPGLVLGIGYILFFNQPANPLNGLYHGMAILVCSTLIHYYTSSHLTAVTALKALDDEYEAVSSSLKVPFYRTFFRVTLPLSLPAVLDIGRYLFVNAMTTISAVVFLYSPDTTLAAVAILNLEESGEIGPACAMASLIVAASSIVCLLYALASRVLLQKTQRWRSPDSR